LLQLSLSLALTRSFAGDFIHPQTMRQTCHRDPGNLGGGSWMWVLNCASRAGGMLKPSLTLSGSPLVGYNSSNSPPR
jgi:hypothetical protein